MGHHYLGVVQIVCFPLFVAAGEPSKLLKLVAVFPVGLADTKQ